MDIHKVLKEKVSSLVLSAVTATATEGVLNGVLDTFNVRDAQVSLETEVSATSVLADDHSIQDVVLGLDCHTDVFLGARRGRRRLLFVVDAVLDLLLDELHEVTVCVQEVSTSAKMHSDTGLHKQTEKENDELHDARERFDDGVSFCDVKRKRENDGE